MYSFNPFDFTNSRTITRNTNRYPNNVIFNNTMYESDDDSRHSLTTVINNLKEQLYDKDQIIHELQSRLNTMEKINNKLNDERSKFNKDVKAAMIACIEKIANCKVVVTQDADMDN